MYSMAGGPTYKPVADLGPSWPSPSSSPPVKPSFPHFYQGSHNQWKIVTQNHSPVKNTRMDDMGVKKEEKFHSRFSQDLTRRLGLAPISVQHSEKRHRMDDRTDHTETVYAVPSHSLSSPSTSTSDMLSLPSHEPITDHDHHIAPTSVIAPEASPLKQASHEGVLPVSSSSDDETLSSSEDTSLSGETAETTSDQSSLPGPNEEVKEERSGFFSPEGIIPLRSKIPYFPVIPQGMQLFQRPGGGFSLDQVTGHNTHSGPFVQFPAPPSDGIDRVDRVVPTNHGLMRIQPLEGMKPGGNFMKIPAEAFLPPPRNGVRQQLNVPHINHPFNRMTVGQNANFGNRLQPQHLLPQPPRPGPNQGQVMNNPLPPKMHATSGPQQHPHSQGAMIGPQNNPNQRQPMNNQPTINRPQTQPPVQPQQQQPSLQRPQKIQHLQPQHSVLVGSSGTHHSVSHLSPPQNMQRPVTQATKPVVPVHPNPPQSLVNNQSVAHVDSSSKIYTVANEVKPMIPVDKPLSISTTTGVPFFPPSKSPEASVLESVMNAVTGFDSLINEVSPLDLT